MSGISIETFDTEGEVWKGEKGLCKGERGTLTS